MTRNPKGNGAEEATTQKNSTPMVLNNYLRMNNQIVGAFYDFFLLISEILEISKRGYTFHEWEEYKEQMQRNEQNEEAINDVFGSDTDESSSSSEDGDNCDQSLKEQEQQQQKSLQNVYSPDATTDSFNSCESKEVCSFLFL